MKVTIFIGGLSGGGAERVCCNIAGFLADKGHCMTIVTMADDEATYGLSPKVTRINLLQKEERKNFIYNSWLRYKRLKDYVCKTDCDAYIVMLPITILILMSLRKKISAKIIASERNMPTLYPKWQQKAMKYIAGKTGGWVFQTLEQQEWYGEAVKSSVCQVIPNAINRQFIREPYIGERKKWIVTVGRLMPQKNQLLLIEAYAKIHKEFPEYILHIYGEGPLKGQLISRVSEVGIQQYVVFDGFVKDVSPFIQDASMFVLSSDYEGMPNALMEAMALGLPCVSTDCGGGGARFLIEDGKNGLLVPQKDVDALADAMRRLLRDKDYAASLGRDANNVCQRLHPDNVYGMWEKFIENVIKE